MPRKTAIAAGCRGTPRPRPPRRTAGARRWWLRGRSRLSPDLRMSSTTTCSTGTSMRSRSRSTRSRRIQPERVRGSVETMISAGGSLDSTTSSTAVYGSRSTTWPWPACRPRAAPPASARAGARVAAATCCSSTTQLSAGSFWGQITVTRTGSAPARARTAAISRVAGDRLVCDHQDVLERRS